MVYGINECETLLLHHSNCPPLSLCSFAVLLIEKGDEEGQSQVLSAALEVISDSIRLSAVMKLLLLYLFSFFPGLMNR